MKETTTTYKCDNCARTCDPIKDYDLDFCSSTCAQDYYFKKDRVVLSSKIYHACSDDIFYRYNGSIYFRKYKITHVFKVSENNDTSGTQDNILLIVEDAGGFKIHRYQHDLNCMYVQGSYLTYGLLKDILDKESDFTLLETYINLER